MIIKNHKRLNERGSIFFYILLGVVLFGALAFTISRGMRSQTTNALTQRQMEIAVAEVLEKAQSFSRALDKIRQNTVSETDLCFAHANISDVNNSAYSNVGGCAEDKAKLYHPNGGSLAFSKVPAEWLDKSHEADQGYAEWVFSAKNSVLGFGQGELNQDSSADLIAHINYMKQDLCAGINRKLGIIGIPENNGAFDPVAPYTGSFTASGQINAPTLSGKRAACFHNAGGNSYVFYAILLERD